MSAPNPSRRKFLKIGAAAVAAAVVVGVGGYEAYKYAYPSKPPVSSVKIGAVLPLTGPYASFGLGQRFGHQQAVADINAQGGVDINGKKVPVSYTVLDDQSQASVASTVTDELILNDNVDILVQGINPPGDTNPMCVEADRYKTPCIMGAPFEPWWAGGPYKYSWSIGFRIGTEPTDETAGSGYDVVDIAYDTTNPYKSQTNSVAAVLASDDADGIGWWGLFPGALKSAGYTVVGTSGNFGLFPDSTTDFSSIITQFKDANAEIVWSNTPPPSFGTFLRQCRELAFEPKVVYGAKAALFYKDVMAWGGNLPQDVGIEVWWDSAYPYKGIGSTTCSSLCNTWSQQNNEPLNGNRSIGFGYAAVQTALDAISRAGTLNKDSVNTAISETDTSFITGPIKFTSTHDSPTALAYGQWQPSSQWTWDCPIVIQPHASLPQPTAQYVFPVSYS